MTDTDKKGFWQRTGIALGLIRTAPTAVRSTELPILASPNYPMSAVNLSPTRPEAVSPDRAIGLAPVYRAIDIISTAVSQLPVGVWRNGEELTGSDVSSLITRPNFDLSRSAFFEQLTVSLMVSGNFYIHLEGKNSPTGKASNLSVFNPHEVYITYEGGKKFYDYQGKRYPDWKIKHGFKTRLPGYDKGVGPIQAAQNELRGALDVRNYSDNWFRDGGVPSGILKNTDQNTKPSPQQLLDAKTLFDTNQSERGRGVIALGGDWTYTPTYLSPKDAQFLESRQFDRTQIALMFGIPATYMLAGVEGNSMTYTNLEMVDTQFVKYTLMKYLREIEEALSDLLPRGQEVRFKVEVLQRADQKTRFESHAIALGNKPWKIENEVRAEEGLLPLSKSQLESIKPAAPAVNPIEGGTNE